MKEIKTFTKWMNEDNSPGLIFSPNKQLKTTAPEKDAEGKEVKYTYLRKEMKDGKTQHILTSGIKDPKTGKPNEIPFDETTLSQKFMLNVT